MNQLLNNETIIIGSRKSRLALIQTELVADLLKQKFPNLKIKIKKIITQGDQDFSIQINDLGIFVKEIEKALLKKEIDLAIHSAKDLPLKIPKGLKFSTVGQREDPRDCLVSFNKIKLKDLPTGSIIGTSSPRREKQILSLRPDLKTINLRGNVETRLEKIKQKKIDATILAVAGLHRLNLKNEITEYFDFPTAAGQGALAVEYRKGDFKIEKIIKSLVVPNVEKCVQAERKFLSHHGDGCYSAIGVTAKISKKGKIELISNS